MNPTYSSIELLQIIVNADPQDIERVSALLKEEFKRYSLQELEVINKVLIMKCGDIAQEVIRKITHG